jgi:hypothetical protein
MPDNPLILYTLSCLFFLGSSNLEISARTNTAFSYFFGAGYFSLEIESKLSFFLDLTLKLTCFFFFGSS